MWGDQELLALPYESSDWFGSSVWTTGLEGEQIQFWYFSSSNKFGMTKIFASLKTCQAIVVPHLVQHNTMELSGAIFMS